MNQQLRGTEAAGRVKRGRAERWIFAFAIASIVVLALGYASLSTFWYDELVTLHASGLGSARAVMEFFNSGKDTTSFLPALLVHAMRRLPQRLEVTARLPFVLAYAGACAFLYGFVRRRYAAGYALAASMIFALGYTFQLAYEIRSYAFLLLGATIAAYCWQRANEDGPRRTLAAFGVFAGLGLAISFHLFGGFLLVPFATAQWMHERPGLKRNWPLWLALAAAPVCGLAEIRGALVARHVYGASFWAKPDLLNFLEIYRLLALSVAEIFPVLLAMLAVLAWLRLSGRVEAPKEDGAGFSAAEWTLQFGLIFLPVIVAVLAHPLGVYRAKYVVPFFVGVAVVAAGLIAEWMRRSPSIGWGIGVALLVLFIAHNQAALRSGLCVVTGRPPPQFWRYQLDWYDAVKQTDLPVVADNGQTLLELDYYGPPELRSRLTFLTSRERALRWPGSMTLELNMEVFAPVFKLPVQDFDSFTRAHPRFLLVAVPGQTWNEWILHYLVSEAQAGHGVRLTLLTDQQGYTPTNVYLVEMPAPDPQ